MKALKRHPLDQSAFYKLRSRKKLAEAFGLTEPQLQHLLRTSLVYREREIETKKPNGTIKRRLTQEPRGRLRDIHERAMKWLSHIDPPDFLFCPVKRRSYVNNASVHIGAAEIRTIDIKDYFNSTPRRRVFWFFKAIMQCERDVASILADMLTVSGHAATGSPVSPILCFFAYYDMWHEIAQLGAANGCKVTVYQDDLTISGSIVPEWLIWEVRKIIDRFGLIYHKERRFTGGIGQITGVVVRDGRTVVPNRQRKRAYEIVVALRDMPEGDDKTAAKRTLGGLRAQRRQVEAG